MLFQSVTLIVYHVLLNLKGLTFTTAPRSKVQVHCFTCFYPQLGVLGVAHRGNRPQTIC